MKKLKLQVLDDRDELIKTYHIKYDETEGTQVRVIVNDITYTVSPDGYLLPSKDVEPVFPIELDEQWATEFKARHNSEPTDKTEFKVCDGKLKYFDIETGGFQLLFEPDTMIPIADENNVVTGSTKS